jgi:hypothetical protein
MKKPVATGSLSSATSRIRNLMALTALAAFLLAVGRNPIGLLVVLSILVVVVVPVVLLESYLYHKGKGVFYEWTHGTRRRRRARPAERALEPDPSPEKAALRRTYGVEWSSRARLRSRLFQEAPPSETVSRAAILLTVAEQMEQSGRPDAARECYRQILRRFSHTQEARQAEERLGARAATT